MKINIQDIERNAFISQLSLTEEEIEAYAKELNKIAEYMEILKEVNTNDVEPLTHIFPTSNMLREDIPGETLSVEESFSNAPEVEERMFKVPKIV